MDETSDSPLVNPVTLISPQFCVPYAVDLAVIRKPKFLKDCNLAVTDVEGNIIFKIKEKAFSFHDRRVLLDAAGNPLLSLKEKLMSTHSRWRVFRGDSDDNKDLIFSVTHAAKSKVDVFLANNTEENDCDFKVTGSWSDRSCIFNINDDFNTMIAKLDKRNTIKREMDEGDFMVKVYPNIDHAFIAALVVIVDAIYSSTSGNAGVNALRMGLLSAVILGSSS